MGLGLPIVQRTIYDHNGQVQIDSTARGTCISMVIPREPKHAEVIIETSANRG
jgi:nitrogen-specific signal transduction histidine kinase